MENTEEIIDPILQMRLLSFREVYPKAAELNLKAWTPSTPGLELGSAGASGMMGTWDAPFSSSREDLTKETLRKTGFRL